MKKLLRNWKTLLTVSLIFGLVAGCGERKKDLEYEKYLLDVNCGDKFKGEIYQMGRTGGGIFLIWYKDMEGRRISFPDEGCVKITLRELPVPTEEGN